MGSDLACAASKVLVALALLVALPAAFDGAMSHAQTLGQPPGAYAPYNAPPAGGKVDDEAAARMLSARGFTNVQVLRRRGPTLLMEANGPRGERVQVVVDSATGAINGMKVIGFGDKRY